MQFISKALIRFSISALSVQVSQPYRKTDVTSALRSLIRDFIEMFLSLQIGFNFARDDVATAILILISWIDFASSVMVAPRYLNCSTNLSSSPPMCAPIESFFEVNEVMEEWLLIRPIFLT